MTGKENECKKAKAKKIRSRSKEYPYYSLQTAVDFVTTIERIAGNKSLAQETLLAHLGIKTATTRTYSGKLSSSRQFGLLEKGRTLRVSELARRLVYPSSDAAKMDALREAFSMPTLYGELIKQFDGKQLPDIGVLANILVTEYGITSGVMRNAAQAFLDSAEFAGVIRDGCLALGGGTDGEISASCPGTLTPRHESLGKHEYGKASISFPSEASTVDGQKVELSLGGNRRVVIACPADLTTDEAQRLKALIDLLARVDSKEAGTNE